MSIKMVLRIIDVKLKPDLEMHMHVFHLTPYSSTIHSALNSTSWEKQNQFNRNAILSEYDTFMHAICYNAFIR